MKLIETGMGTDKSLSFCCGHELFSFVVELKMVLFEPPVSYRVSNK
jgi:hypothetical protein